MKNGAKANRKTDVSLWAKSLAAWPKVQNPFQAGREEQRFCSRVPCS
jgi:hypothetical protein